LVTLLVLFLAVSAAGQEKDYIDGIELNQDRTETVWGAGVGWARAALYHVSISGVVTYRTPVDPAYLAVDLRLDSLNPVEDVLPEADQLLAFSIQPGAGLVFLEHTEPEIVEIEIARRLVGSSAAGDRYMVTFARTMLERLYQTSVRVDYDLTILPSALNHYPTVGLELFSFMSGAVPRERGSKRTHYSDWRLYSGVGYDATIGAQSSLLEAIGVDVEAGWTTNGIRWTVESTFMPFNETMILRDVTVLASIRFSL
jgi:hypothetical protein